MPKFGEQRKTALYLVVQSVLLKFYILSFVLPGAAQWLDCAEQLLVSWQGRRPAKYAPESGIVVMVFFIIAIIDIIIVTIIIVTIVMSIIFINGVIYIVPVIIVIATNITLSSIDIMISLCLTPPPTLRALIGV